MIDDKPIDIMRQFAAQAAREDMLAFFQGGALHATLPQVVDVVPMPNMSARAENYIREMDLLLEDAIDPGQTFVEELLIPAIGDVLHARIAKVVWWANVAAADSSPEPSDDSLIGTVRKYLTEHLGVAKK